MGRVFSTVLGALLLFAFVVFWGPSDISLGEAFNALFSLEGQSVAQTIVWDIRFPKALTAFAAGAALGCCGLILQTWFHNPLAGPFVLGVHGGATLAMALWVLGGTSLFGIESFGPLGPIFPAIVGAVAVLLFLVALASRWSSKILLIVFGLIFGHMVGGVIDVLLAGAEAIKIREFVLWTLGSFEKVHGPSLWIFLGVIIMGITAIWPFRSALDLLYLGDSYAHSSGLDLKKTQWVLVCITGLLSGVVTAFCGPIAFVGVVGPHIARFFARSESHKELLPLSIFIGGSLTLLATLISGGLIGVNPPLNAALGLLGAPLILVYLVKKERAWV